MATFTFDGTTSQTTAFNATVDRVVFNLDAADLASVSEDRANNTITFVATSGAVLTLTGTNFAALTGTNLVPGFESNIVFGIGTVAGETLVGNVIIGLDGGDTLNAFRGEGNFDGALVFGNQGNDTINADGANVRLYGGQGDDTFNLGSVVASSSSLIVGGLGEDIINVGGATAQEGEYAGNITIFGGNEAGDPTDGDDTITVALADTATATIFGNGGDDDITITGSGNASVYGGQGDDTITAEVNTGLFVGGLGGDTIDVTLTGDDASATIFGGNGAGDAVDGDDLITVTAGDGASATIYGNGGDDVITLVSTGEGATESAGTFQVFGGQGNDVITGTVGDGSVIYGGLGIDNVEVTVSGTGGSVTVFGGNGDADAADSADVIEVALAGAGTENINGVVVPTAGQTAVIYGNGGDDIITVTGEGSATVFGGSGDDVINVGNGQYVLTGGVGEDTFNFAGAEGRTTTETLSSITDFTFGEDSIVFNSSVTSTTVGRATLATAADLDAIITAGGQGDNQVAVITVTGGDLAGSYAVNADQVINITGFTGTIDAASFSGGAA